MHRTTLIPTNPQDFFTNILEEVTEHRIYIAPLCPRQEITAVLQRELNTLLENSQQYPDQHQAFVIKLNETGENIGQLWYRFQEEAYCMGHVFLLWIFIKEDFRRHGYATEVLGALIHKLRLQEIHSIGLEVYTDNEAAKRLYQKVGFTPKREILIAPIS